MVAIICPPITSVITLPAFEVLVRMPDYTDRCGLVIIADSEEEAREKFRLKMENGGNIGALTDLKRGNISFRSCEVIA